MNLFFLAYANSTHAVQLESLDKEYKEVYKILAKFKELDTEWDIYPGQNATTSDLTDYLTLYKNKICLFMFSGHAGEDRLITKDGNANAEGLAGLLGQCPNLQLVILNGCSTHGQVQALLDAGVPCVIATSASVEDESASQFAITLFRNLAEQRNDVQIAYEEALKVAKTHTNKKIESYRESGRANMIDSDEPLWGLFTKTGYEFILDWRLEKPVISRKGFKPNDLLLAKIWEAIAPYLILELEANQLSTNNQIEKILNELPYPLSEYLRKLMAKPLPEENEKDFCGELSKQRLIYLKYTYAINIELLTYILMSQLWDELSNKKIKTLPPDLKLSIAKFLSMGIKNRKTYDLLPLLQLLWQCFEKNFLTPFIAELKTFFIHFRVDKDLYKACQQMEEIRIKTAEENNLNEQAAKNWCIELETHLAVLMGHLGFMASYKLTSIKDIDFIKYKHQTEPTYKHHYVELRFRSTGLVEESQEFSDSVDIASVILEHKKDKSRGFLNLSPFIIDETSLSKVGETPSLCMFYSFEKQADTFIYHYVFKSHKKSLFIRKETPYFKLVADQLNEFFKLVLDCKLTDYQPRNNIE